jgi:hypothetical protein
MGGPGAPKFNPKAPGVGGDAAKSLDPSKMKPPGQPPK